MDSNLEKFFQYLSLQISQLIFCVLCAALVLLVSVFLIGSSLTPAVQAQSLPDAEVEFFVKTPERGQPVTVGDQITLRLEITHPTASRVVLPQLEPQWEAFVVVDQSPPQTVDHADNTSTTGKDIVVALFQPGQYQTPSIVVTHRKPDGSIEELAAPVIPIRVTSVLTDLSELQDLKPQADLPEPLFWPWIIAGLILVPLLFGLLVALAMWLYRRRQSRPKPELMPVPFIDMRPPETIAHAELDRIEALSLPTRNQVKEHYALVALCLRRYIEGRYHISALEQTTTELRNAFIKSRMPLQETGGLMGIIAESDLVKFARYMPYAEEVNGLVDKARTVVDATTPKPTEPTFISPPTEKEEVAV